MYKTSAWKANSTAEYSSKTDNSGNYEYDKKFSTIDVQSVNGRVPMNAETPTIPKRR